MRLLPNTASWAVLVVSVAWFLQPWFDADLHLTFSPKYAGDVFVDVCEGVTTRLFPTAPLVPTLMLTSDSVVVLSAVTADNSSINAHDASKCECGKCSMKPTQVWWCLAANQHGSEVHGDISPLCVPVGADPTMQYSGSIRRTSYPDIIGAEVASQVLLQGIDVGGLVLQSIVLVSFGLLAETRVQTVQSTAMRYFVTKHPSIVTETLNVRAVGRPLAGSHTIWPVSLTAVVRRNETRMVATTKVVVTSPVNGAWLNSDRFDIISELSPPTGDFHRLCLCSLKEDDRYTMDTVFERFGAQERVKYQGSPLVAAGVSACLNPGGLVASSTSQAAAEISMMLVAVNATSLPIAFTELVSFRFNLGGAYVERLR
jgi:hypothetical protein